MPRYSDGRFVIIQKFEDGQYLKTSDIQSMLNDVLVALNDLYIEDKNKFTSIINVPQMTNVVTGALDNDAVAYGTASGNFTFPINAICMYSYEQFYLSGLPKGFEMCDGNNGTPDLRKKYEKDYFYIKRVY